jgi:hypothetical protein
MEAVPQDLDTQHANTARGGSMELVYGELGDNLIIMPRAKALALHGIQMALSSSKTWGDLKLALPVDLYRGLVLRYREDMELDEEDPQFEDGEPRLDATLDYFEGLLADGDFPDWPEQDALTWMPKEIQEQFGRITASTLNGDYLELAPKDASAIITALTARGYECHRDEELIRHAKSL